MSNLGGTTDRDARDTGQEPQARTNARSDAIRWREWMQVAFPDAVHDGRESGSLLDIAEVRAMAEELAHYLAAVSHVESGSWDFTLDLGHMGQIAGQVSADAGEIRITLYPRTRRLLKMLRTHRETIELMAGAEMPNGIALEIG